MVLIIVKIRRLYFPIFDDKITNVINQDKLRRMSAPAKKVDFIFEFV